MTAALSPQEAETGFSAPDTLSSRHQDLLWVSPLLREHCADELLSREEEQALFEQISATHREIFTRMLKVTAALKGVIEWINHKAAEESPTHRLGTQLRGLHTSPILEAPLSTDAYTDYIEELVLEQIKKVNQCQVKTEQIALLSEIILHPTLRNEVAEIYRHAYEKIRQRSEPATENHQRITRLQSKLEQLKHKVVKYNLRLVIKHAAVYAKHHLDIHDLIQEGTLGLMRACDLYDFRRGYKFSTYASRWVLQTILNLLNEITFTIQVPRNISQTYRNVNQYIDEQVKQCGTAPSSLEIAEALQLKEKDVITALRSTWVASSLNTPLNHEAESAELIDFIEDEEEDAYEKVDLFMQYRVIKQLIEKIPSERDREILKRRYAIGYGESTLEEIANIYGLTKERIRQIINQNLKVIRQEVGA